MKYVKSISDSSIEVHILYRDHFDIMSLRISVEFINIPCMRRCSDEALY